MSKVFTTASVSLDGYLAGPAESGFEYLMDWLNNGDVEVPASDRSFHMTAPSARVWNEFLDISGVAVVGRRLFDLTDGWHGNPPVSKPCVVVSHSVPDGWADRETAVPFEFVSGIESAIERAKEIAGDKWVSVNGGTIASQALSAGLLDEIWVSQAPVLLGGGVPFLSELKNAPVVLEGPTEIVQGKNITHLRYVVKRGG